MKITELIKALEALKEEHGDLTVVYQTISHVWAVDEPKIRKTMGGKVILVNP